MFGLATEIAGDLKGLSNEMYLALDDIYMFSFGQK
jgi:hypothetical protein